MVIGMDSDLLYPLFEQEEVRYKLHVHWSLSCLPLSLSLSIPFPNSLSLSFPFPNSLSLSIPFPNSLSFSFPYPNSLSLSIY